MLNEKLRDIEARYEEIEASLYAPEVAADIEKSTALSKEQKNLQPVVEKYREYKALLEEADEMRRMLTEDELDSELEELAKESLAKAEKEAPLCLEELKILMLPKDANDERNVIIEIRASAGGEEAALFAAVLYRMYGMYADARGWKTETVNSNPTELGGFREIEFMMSGEGVYSRMKFESGVHRVQRIPVTETNGKIQTSTATVAVLPEAEDVDIDINPKDLKIDTFRSSGAGGQHINKTSSAIRITHLPTGTVVECQDERSQYKNKDKAMKVLRTRLLSAEQEKSDARRSGLRRSQVGTGDRSEKIRTYNFPQSRVTDHRINLSVFDIEGFVNGKMDQVLDALITADNAERLKNELNED